MASYLLDSDVLIWLLRDRRETVAMVENLIQQSAEPLACSAMSVLEIWVGAKPGETARTELLFSHLAIIPVDGRIARRASELLTSRKRTAPDQWVDAIIAASSLLHGMTLVTYNRRDYPHPGIALYPA